MSRRADMIGPVRSCVGCGRRDAQDALVRLGRDATGGLTVSGFPRTGRGAYVHAEHDCVAGLARSKALGKSLRATITKDARQAAMRTLAAQIGGAQIGAGSSSERQP